MSAATSVGPCPTTFAGADPLRALDPVQRHAADRFLHRLGGGGIDAVAADVDGDGRLEVVLLWMLRGAAGAGSATLTVLAGAGQLWRDAASVGLGGCVERISVVEPGGVVRIATRVPGANDACATRTATRPQRLRFVAGRLLPAPG